MSKNIQNQEPELAVVEAVGKTEQFIEKYKKSMLYGGAAIIIVAAALFSYQRFYSIPLQQEAINQTFVAEQYFRTDSFNIALNGDGNALGFKQIINEYGSKGGAAVYFYAGVSALQLGEFQEAISYLKSYNGDDPIISARAIACIGDAYAGLNNYTEAANYYVKAAAYADNVLASTYLLKAGLVYEEIGKKAESLKLYQEIKSNYPQTAEGYEIDKYISRLQLSM